LVVVFVTETETEVLVTELEAGPPDPDSFEHAVITSTGVITASTTLLTARSRLPVRIIHTLRLTRPGPRLGAHTASGYRACALFRPEQVRRTVRKRGGRG